MIEVTERAKRELKRLLEASVDWPEARLRLIDRGGGVLGLGIDIQTLDDEIVEYEGKIILISEPKLWGNLKGITLDVDDTPYGIQLVILDEPVEQSVVVS